MRTRILTLGLLAALLAGLGSGCHKETPVAKPAPLPSGTLARLHWLGRERITTATNSAHFMQVWNLRSSIRLENQTLDKLAAAPFGLPNATPNANLAATNLLSASTGTNALLAARLRSMLDDVVQQESYLEVREVATNQAPELAWAIRLDDQTAARWATNLPAILQAIAGTSSPDASATAGQELTLQFRHGAAAPLHFQTSRAGDWSLFGLASAQNGLLSEWEARIRSGGTPVSSSLANSWLGLEADLPRLARAFGWNLDLPGSLATLSLAMEGDPEGVHTLGELNFNKPLALELEAWQIPTNLIREKIVGFTAVRGFQPFTAMLKPLASLPAVAPINQFLAWDRSWSPFETYCAAPTAQASNCVEQIASNLLVRANPWITNNSLGDLTWSTNFYGLIWDRTPYMRPFLREVKSDGTDYLGAGFSAYYITNTPIPTQLFHAVTSEPKLVYYDWELTGPRIQAWYHIGQLLRVLLLRPQLPSGSVGALWLDSLEKRLGNNVTAVTWTAPNQLSFTRRSAIGLTGFELHLLVDWLESSRFPAGLHTLDGPSMPSLHHRLPHAHPPVGTNRPPFQVARPKPLLPNTVGGAH